MDAYIGEIRPFGGNFAPAKWLFCDGAMHSVDEYQLLYTVIGDTFGTGGATTFAVPDLRGRVPLGVGTLGDDTYQLADTGGVTEVTLNEDNYPEHWHTMIASVLPGTTSAPGENVLAAVAQADCKIYFPGIATLSLNPAQLTPAAGGGESHTNIQPYLAMNYIICADGVLPSNSNGAT